ncbi:thioesterase family protein [Diaporthe sp. PMI_573]|nr:thioesterase family protein [Diaporthaceae sp. PMI_573]
MSSILEKQIGLCQLSNDTFAANWHSDWAIGPTLLGDCVTSIIQLAAQTFLRTDPVLVKVNQPDVLSLHVEFLRVCTHDDSVIKVIPLKVGGTVSTLQLQLLQGDKVKIIAIANSTNFDVVLGPTASAPECWKFSPTLKPKPDFDAGEILPVTGRLLVLDPRDGFPDNGVCDAWRGFMGDERIDATYLPLMGEIMPSLSDTLLRNGGPYDARAMQVATVNINVQTEREYKRRLPTEGLRFTFTRATAKTLLDGRMDVDLTICNEDMDAICLARQLILALGVHRKFGGEPKQPESKL